MKLALWTPRPQQGWPARITAWLASRLELAVVSAEPPQRPPADLDVYHLANDATHGFVYRALLVRPGIVLLDEWNLHALVLAETAGRGDVEAYRREARRERGATGGFVAGQVLQGTGGALPQLLPLNGRVLDASVALVTTSEEVRGRATRRLGGRPLLSLAAGDEAAVEHTLGALLEIARGGRSRLAERTRALGEERALTPTPLGRALAELRPRAHDVGLPELPDGVRDRVAALLSGPAVVDEDGAEDRTGQG